MADTEPSDSDQTDQTDRTEVAEHAPSTHSSAHVVAEFHVNELASDLAGSLSPFGPELEFPLPPEQLFYRHPKPENRPHLAGGH